MSEEYNLRKSTSTNVFIEYQGEPFKIGVLGLQKCCGESDFGFGKKLVCQGICCQEGVKLWTIAFV